MKPVMPSPSLVILTSPSVILTSPSVILSEAKNLRSCLLCLVPAGELGGHRLSNHSRHAIAQRHHGPGSRRNMQLMTVKDNERQNGNGIENNSRLRGSQSRSQILALSQGERVDRDRRFHQPARAR